MTNYPERIRDLQLKAASKQAMVDSCEGHIWKADYVSLINQTKGSTASCVRCGERRGWNQIGPEEQWVGDVK